MTAEAIIRVRHSIKAQRPLIHCITNPISIDQCANAILALGARPIMAEHPQEVAGITATANALLLNLGNITDARMASMRIAAKTAEESGIPSVLDLVGVACSKLRRDFATELLETAVPTVIKGNYSEIAAFCDSSYRCAGVDAEDALDEAAVTKAAAALAKKYGCVVLASGKCDIVTDGRALLRIRNGTPQLAAVTGTGCMLGALCASYLAAQPDMTAAVTACAVMGICGELAETDRGNGSFLVELMDKLTVLTDEELKKYVKTEATELESF